MKADIDSEVFLPGIYQQRNELSDLDKVASTERLSIIIVDALVPEKMTTIKIQASRYPDFSLEEIENMMKTIFIKSFAKKVVSYQKESRDELQGSGK